LGMSKVGGNVSLKELRISNDFRSAIREAQERMTPEELYKMLPTQDGKVQEGIFRDKDGMWSYKGRICVPDSGYLRREILEEAH
ncbi:hypothetical protein PIB30_053775, partial [Stylosanthes scabra]|nr:hypothetical protein [Stylosanthes scabra]